MAVRAQVRTRDGWAVRHAVVTVTDATGVQVLRATADEEGRVTAADKLPPGPYTVVVTALGYAPVARTAVVTAAGRADVGSVVLTRQGGDDLPPPGTWTLDPDHSSVGAVAQHLGISSVHGRFKEFGGRIEITGGPAGVEASRVEAVISAASVDTGSALRDKHLRSQDFLDVERHPRITYRSTGLAPAGPGLWTVHGVLALHGIEREVDLGLRHLGTERDPWGRLRTAFHATAELRRADFAMDYNQVVQAGISLIGTTLKVDLHIEAVREEQAAGGQVPAAEAAADAEASPDGGR